MDLNINSIGTALEKTFNRWSNESLLYSPKHKIEYPVEDQNYYAMNRWFFTYFSREDQLCLYGDEKKDTCYYNCAYFNNFNFDFQGKDHKICVGKLWHCREVDNDISMMFARPSTEKRLLDGYRIGYDDPWQGNETETGHFYKVGSIVSGSYEVLNIGCFT